MGNENIHINIGDIMSELSKNVNKFFKFATKIELNNIREELSLDEHLDKVLIMFYIKHKDIDYIASLLGYSESKIKSDLRLIRRKLSKLL